MQNVYQALIEMIVFYSALVVVVLIVATIVAVRNRDEVPPQEPTPPPNHPVYPTRRVLPSVEPTKRVKRYQAVRLSEPEDVQQESNKVLSFAAAAAARGKRKGA